MQRYWLHKSGCKDLIIFCNGWGMDERPFQLLKSDHYDVLCLYDYRQVDDFEEIDSLAEKYQQLYLIAWSMGVWVGQKIFSKKKLKKNLFERTIAINGTLCPRDDNYGIPLETFDGTLNSFTAKSRTKFYLRMCRQKKIFQSFLDMQPDRTVADQLEELRALRDAADCQPVCGSIYREIIISDHDLIMPTANQQKFWYNCSVVTVPGFHYIFNSWQSWDELLEISPSSCPA